MKHSRTSVGIHPHNIILLSCMSMDQFAAAMYVTAKSFLKSLSFYTHGIVQACHAYRRSRHATLAIKNLISKFNVTMYVFNMNIRVTSVTQCSSGFRNL